MDFFLYGQESLIRWQRWVDSSRLVPMWIDTNPCEISKNGLSAPSFSHSTHLTHLDPSSSRRIWSILPLRHPYLSLLQASQHLKLSLTCSFSLLLSIDLFVIWRYQKRLDVVFKLPSYSLVVGTFCEASVHFTSIVAPVVLIVVTVDLFDICWLAGPLTKHQEEDHNTED